MKQLVLFILIIVCTVQIAFAEGVKRRGKYVRTDVVDTEKTEVFAVRLKKCEGAFLQFEFRKRLKLKLHEVRMYETIEEIVHLNNGGDGITPTASSEYRIILGEFMEGEHSERIEYKDDGPLKLEAFKLNDQTYSTDINGIWIDDDQTVLSMFDDLRSKPVELVFSHQKYGTANIILSRNIIAREAEVMPGVEAPEQGDVLEKLGMNFTQLRQSVSDGLSVNVIAPSLARPGEIVPVTVEVKNSGLRSCSNLIGRSFSSVSGMEGKLFYYGVVLPGQTRTFSRLMTVQPGAGICFCRVGFWSGQGALPKVYASFSIKVAPEL